MKQEKELKDLTLEEIRERIEKNGLPLIAEEIYGQLHPSMSRRLLRHKAMLKAGKAKLYVSLRNRKEKWYNGHYKLEGIGVNLYFDHNLGIKFMSSQTFHDKYIKNIGRNGN